jgi:hypothetical protein
MSDTFTVVLNITDSSFDPQDTLQYGLAIVFSEMDFSCCVTDLKRGKCIGLHHMVRNDVIAGHGSSQDKPAFAQFLSDAVTHWPFLKNQFKLLKIAYEETKATLIPSPLFDPLEVSGYLSFSFGPIIGDQVFADHLVNPDAYQVFSVPVSLIQPVVGHFQKHRIISSSSIFIESIWMNYKSRMHTPKLFVNIRALYMDLMIFDGHQMIFFNSFSYQCAEDFAYYIIFVLEQLKLNPELVPLVLFGDAGKIDGLLDLLFNYLKHIEFGKRNAFVKYSDVLGDVPAHTHYPLLSFLSCGL